MKQHWAIAVVVAGREREIQNVFAGEYKLECWYPVGTVITKPKRKHQPIHISQPVFAGYIFVTYRPLMLISLLHEGKLKGLLGYIQDGENVFPLPGEVIADLKRREDSGEFDQLVAKAKERKSFVKGDRVLITNSVLGSHINGKVGIVQENCLNKQNVSVIVSGLKLRMSVAFAEKIA